MNTKNKKQGSYILSGLLFLLTLSGCNMNTDDAKLEQEKKDQDDLNAFQGSYKLPLAKNDTESSVTGDFFPYSTNTGVQINVTSDKENVISQGTVNPSTSSDEKVNLTLTFRKGTATATRTYALIVPQMAYYPKFSEIVGTWKRTRKESFEGTDKTSVDDDYTETTTTIFTISEDSSFLQKDKIIKADVSGREEIRYQDLKGTISSGQSVEEGQTDRISSLMYKPTFFRSSNTTAFTDDDSGWIQYTQSDSYLTLSPAVLMYKGLLCTNFQYQRSTARDECLTSLPSKYSSWMTYGIGYTIDTKFFDDSTLEIRLNDNLISEGGTYTVNQDGTLSIRYKNISTGKDFEETKYFKTIFTKRVVQDFFGITFLYYGDVPFEEAMYTKQ